MTASLLTRDALTRIPIPKFSAGKSIPEKFNETKKLKCYFHFVDAAVCGRWFVQPHDM